jgi:hypothetical protein
MQTVIAHGRHSARGIAVEMFVARSALAVGRGHVGALPHCLLRAQHENTILGLAEMVKYSQCQEATKARQGLEQSLANASQRYTYYQKLLGGTDAQIKTSIPQLDALDQGSLQNLTFSQADGSSEPQMPLDPIIPNIAGDSTSVSDGEIKTLSNHEVEELNKLALSRDAQLTASVLEAVGSGLAIIPQFGVHAQPMGVGVTAGFGGQQLHDMTSALAAVARAFAEEYSYEANKTSKLGSYSRRELEWLFQSNSAKGEINQIFKQLRGAQIREAIAQKEYDNHQKQMLQAQQVVDFLQGNEINGGFQVKETTTGFYAWMKREVKALYAKSFQLGFEIAKKAERAEAKLVQGRDFHHRLRRQRQRFTRGCLVHRRAQGAVVGHHTTALAEPRQKALLQR